MFKVYRTGNDYERAANAEIYFLVVERCIDKFFRKDGLVWYKLTKQTIVCYADFSLTITFSINKNNKVD